MYVTNSFYVISLENLYLMLCAAVMVGLPLGTSLRVIMW